MLFLYLHRAFCHYCSFLLFWNGSRKLKAIAAKEAEQKTREIIRGKKMTDLSEELAKKRAGMSVEMSFVACCLLLLCGMAF